MQNVPWTTTTLIFQKAQASPDPHGNPGNIQVRTFLMGRPLTYLGSKLQVCAFVSYCFQISDTYFSSAFKEKGQKKHQENVCRDKFTQRIKSENEFVSEYLAVYVY